MRYEALDVSAVVGDRPPEGAGDAPVRAVEEARRRLAAGELLVHPTGTLYGLGGADRPDVDREVARLKGRDPSRPFLRLAPDVSAVRARPGIRWDERAERLAAALWPGPLTLVLEAGGPDGLAVRVDAHPLLGRLLAPDGPWLTSTSVNRSGDPPAAAPAEVRRCLEALPEPDRRLTFLDAGSLPPSPPSTLVSLRGERARLLRAGAVDAETLRRALRGAPLETGPTARAARDAPAAGSTPGDAPLPASRSEVD